VAQPKSYLVDNFYILSKRPVLFDAFHASVMKMAVCSFLLACILKFFALTCYQ
jgi:hypothetical protein